MNKPKRKTLAEQLREAEQMVDSIPDTPREEIDDQKAQTGGPTRAIREQFSDQVPAKQTTFIALEEIEVLPELERDESEYRGRDFEDLKASIKASGMNDMPVELRYTPGKPEGTAYQLVAGHRRFRALKELGFETAYATVRNLTDAQMDRLHEIENAKRAGKVPWSLAKQLHAMYTSGRYGTQAELAKAIDRDEGTVSRYINVIKDAPRGLWDRVTNPHKMSARDAANLVKAYAKDGFRDWAAAQRKDMSFDTLMEAAKKHLKRPAARKTAVEQIREIKRGSDYHIVLPAELPDDVRRDVLKFAKERAQK